MGRKRAGSKGGRVVAAKRRPPLRRRTIRKWAAPVLVAVALAISMASAVKRGSHARHLSLELEALQRAEQITLERLAAERARADSLASRSRIREAAAALGLRPATEREITFLEDVGMGGL